MGGRAVRAVSYVRSASNSDQIDAPIDVTEGRMLRSADEHLSLNARFNPESGQTGRRLEMSADIRKRWPTSLP
jgi:hypothetical protein